jgi:malate dehydrogenase (oxaloacetate-decarboxylating)
MVGQTAVSKKDFLEVRLCGRELLEDSVLNKGTAFSEEERDAFKLRGLLPNRIFSLEQHAALAYEQFNAKTSNIEKNIFLTALQDRNETVFFKLLADHTEELVPFIYTPVEALAVERYSHIYRRPRGLFLSYPDRSKLDDILSGAPDDIEAIVVTDAEAILGIGDQGVGGIGICVGKLAIYTTCAGIHPAKTMPIVLDVGTNRKELIDDPLYQGWLHERLSGQEYDDFIEAFVQAVMKKWPKVCLQFEDFGRGNARRIVDKYRTKLLTFNDDMQGTGAVALAAILAAVKVSKTKLADQRVVIFGAGSAGTGIADQICSAMMRDGLTEQQAKERLWLIDVQGLLHNGLANLPEFQQRFARAQESIKGWKVSDGKKISLSETVKNVHPTILIGTSTQPKTFTEEIVRDMAAHVEHPIIFPLSNPTELHEAVPADLVNWTDGKALIATGSPFASVKFGGRTIEIGECNNCLIFPGLALGAIASQAKHITDDMIHAASDALSHCSPAFNQSDAALVPNIRDVREVSRKVAQAVGLAAQDAGLAPKTTPDQLAEMIDAKMWEPKYVPYKRV